MDLPSVTGVGVAGLGPAVCCDGMVTPSAAGAFLRQRTRPVSRSRHRVSSRPGLKAVRKIRSAATTGEEYPEGTGTCHRMLLFGPKWTGGLAVSEIARPPA